MYTLLRFPATFMLCHPFMLQPASPDAFYAARTRAEHRDHRAAEVLTRFDFNLIQFIHSWFAKTREKSNRFFFKVK